MQKYEKCKCPNSDAHYFYYESCIVVAIKHMWETPYQDIRDRNRGSVVRYEKNKIE